jgi:hypothetical protein
VTATVTDARALSIRRPWAELIINGDKDIENRTWSTTYRGLVYIHAGKAFDVDGAILARIRGVRFRSDPREQPTGYIGTAILIGVHQSTGCCPEWGEPGPHVYHWMFTNPARFVAPISGPGQRRLYRPPQEVLTARHQGNDREDARHG